MRLVCSKPNTAWNAPLPSIRVPALPRIENLDSLKSADLLILFARRMTLREDQMELIRAHWEQAKPIVGIRTAQHAFQKADNAIIDRKLFGGDYGVGPSSNGGYKTAIAKWQENHLVLKGVGEINAAKYAYGNGQLAESAVVLQIVGRWGACRSRMTSSKEYVT